MTPPAMNPIESSDLSTAVIFLIPVAGVIGIFTLLAVVGWARERRRERESLYRHETARKLVEQGQMTFEQFSAFEQAEAERPLAQRKRGLSLAGTVLVMGGMAFWFAGRQTPDLADLAAVGFVPVAIGVGLLLNAGHVEKRSRSK